MGRGRAKAKQTKVARELKYSSPSMDLDALQRELGTGTTAVYNGDARDSSGDLDDVDDYEDPYAPESDEDEDAGASRTR